MSTATLTRRKRRLGVLGVLGVAAGAIGAASLMPAASAAPVELEAPITGSLNVGGNAGEIPAGTAFKGTWDDETFTFGGTITYGAGSTTVNQPGIGDVLIGLQITEVTPVDGTFDPVAGTAQATTTVTLTLTELTLPDAEPTTLVNCDFTPINLDLDGTVTEADDGSYVLNLSQEGFSIPAVGATDCSGLAGLINPRLAGSDNTVNLQISTAADQEIPETTTTVPPETTTTVPGETTTTVPGGGNGGTGGTGTPAAAPAAPRSGTATYTG